MVLANPQAHNTSQQTPMSLDPKKTKAAYDKARYQAKIEEAKEDPEKERAIQDARQVHRTNKALRMKYQNMMDPFYERDQAFLSLKKPQQDKIKNVMAHWLEESATIPSAEEIQVKMHACIDLLLLESMDFGAPSNDAAKQQSKPKTINEMMEEYEAGYYEKYGVPCPVEKLQLRRDALLEEARLEKEERAEKNRLESQKETALLQSVNTLAQTQNTASTTLAQTQYTAQSTAQGHQTHALMQMAAGIHPGVARQQQMMAGMPHHHPMHGMPHPQSLPGHTQPMIAGHPSAALQQLPMAPTTPGHAPPPPIPGSGTYSTAAYDHQMNKRSPTIEENVDENTFSADPAQRNLDSSFSVLDNTKKAAVTAGLKTIGEEDSEDSTVAPAGLKTTIPLKVKVELKSSNGNDSDEKKAKSKVTLTSPSADQVLGFNKNSPPMSIRRDQRARANNGFESPKATANGSETLTASTSVAPAQRGLTRARSEYALGKENNQTHGGGAKESPRESSISQGLVRSRSAGALIKPKISIAQGYIQGVLADKMKEINEAGGSIVASVSKNDGKAEPFNIHLMKIRVGTKGHPDARIVNIDFKNQVAKTETCLEERKVAKGVSIYMVVPEEKKDWYEEEGHLQFQNFTIKNVEMKHSMKEKIVNVLMDLFQGDRTETFAIPQVADAPSLQAFRESICSSFDSGDTVDGLNARNSIIKTQSQSGDVVLCFLSSKESFEGDELDTYFAEEFKKKHPPQTTDTFCQVLLGFESTVTIFAMLPGKSQVIFTLRAPDLSGSPDVVSAAVSAILRAPNVTGIGFSGDVHGGETDVLPVPVRCFTEMALSNKDIFFERVDLSKPQQIHLLPSQGHILFDLCRLKEGGKELFDANDGNPLSLTFQTKFGASPEQLQAAMLFHKFKEVRLKNITLDEPLMNFVENVLQNEKVQLKCIEQEDAYDRNVPAGTTLLVLENVSYNGTQLTSVNQLKNEEKDEEKKESHIEMAKAQVKNDKKSDDAEAKAFSEPSANGLFGLADIPKVPDDAFGVQNADSATDKPFGGFTFAKDEGVSKDGGSKTDTDTAESTVGLQPGKCRDGKGGFRDLTEDDFTNLVVQEDGEKYVYLGGTEKVVYRGAQKDANGLIRVTYHDEAKGKNNWKGVSRFTLEKLKSEE